MKIKVVGGTHLGVVGCFGTKTFRVGKEEDIHEMIRKNQRISEKECQRSSYKQNGLTIHYFHQGSKTIFEYYYEVRPSRRKRKKKCP